LRADFVPSYADRSLPHADRSLLHADCALLHADPAPSWAGLVRSWRRSCSVVRRPRPVIALDQCPHGHALLSFETTQLVFFGVNMAMDQGELQALEQALRARARVLRGEVSEKLGDAAADAGGMNAGGDFGDQSFAAGESSLDLAEAQRDIEELQGIDAALASMAEGAYGFCASCGDEIPTARLRVQPLALRCVRCQEGVERSHGDRHSSI